MPTTDFSFKLLNTTSVKKLDAIQAYYYKHYAFFQNERSKRIDALKDALNKHCLTYAFDGWHRLIAYQFSNSPLSSKGSVAKNGIGGRFNIGDLDTLKFPSFPALYIAEDYETAYREKFQKKSNEKINGLSANELALNKKTSIVDILLEGKIDIVFDLTKSNTLSDFFNVIKPIKLPKTLANEAKKLTIPIIRSVEKLQELRCNLLNDKWRVLPMQWDIPSNPQIFGQIIHAAGIEAILYPSRMKSNKKCLAIFPKNFHNSLSHIQIKGKIPEEVKINQLDSETYKQLAE